MTKHAMDKTPVIAAHKLSDTDTGSPEVQIALQTARINALTEHFKTHVKDHHSRRGLLLLVSKRKALLEYLKRMSLDRYRKLVNTLNIRK